MNNKKYWLNFDFITLRVKDIEKMKDFYVKLLKIKILKDSEENGKKEVILGTKLKEIIKMVSFGNETLKNGDEANVFHMACLLPKRENSTGVEEIYISLNLTKIFQTQEKKQ